MLMPWGRMAWLFAFVVALVFIAAKHLGRETIEIICLALIVLGIALSDGFWG